MRRGQSVCGGRQVAFCGRRWFEPCVAILFGRPWGSHLRQRGHRRIRRCRIHSLFLCHWGDGSACCGDFITEVVGDSRFGGSAWVDFTHGVDIDRAAVGLVPRAHNGISSVFCICLAGCRKVDGKFLTYAAEGSDSYYTVSLHRVGRLANPT